LACAPYRARRADSRSLGGNLAVPPTLMGFSGPFAVFLSPAGEHVFRRLAPACRFTLRPAQLTYLVAGSDFCRIKAKCVWASGVCPREQAVLNVVRPRLSLGTKGRSDHTANPAMGFSQRTTLGPPGVSHRPRGLEQQVFVRRVAAEEAGFTGSSDSVRALSDTRMEPARRRAMRSRFQSSEVAPGRFRPWGESQLPKG
jgi:hypothetical protein